MGDAREKLIERIRKLRAKGENHAVSEAEANAFLDAAARMMAEHAVDLGDLARAGMSAEGVEKKGVHISLRKMHPACQCLSAIGQLTGTHIGIKVRTSTLGRSRQETGFLLISGRTEDREIADYMFDQVRNLIDGAWRAERERRVAPVRRAIEKTGHSMDMLPALLRDPELKADMKGAGHGVGAKERRSFGFGMAHRLAERIKAMAVRGKDSENALVVWQRQYESTDNKNRQPDLDPVAYLLGDRAGKDAVLGQGVASGQRAVLSVEEEKTT